VSEEIMGKALIVVDDPTVCGHSLPLRLSVVDDLDLSTEAQARFDLRAALDAAEVTECVLDASRVFVDVRGLAVLLDGAKYAREHGRRLVVAASRPLLQMCHVLDLAGELSLVDVPAREAGTAQLAGAQHGR
jgi:anti-anti-sigma regulatory factor